MINDPLMNIAISAARNASDIIVRGYDRLDKVNIQHKAPADLVTDIDVESERTIIETIHTAYPNHAILGEESGTHENVHDVQWIIDPLDGTNNFAHGFPHFCISIGIKQNAKLTHGLIYDPLRNEMFMAQRGVGAYLNDRRIRVSNCNDITYALLATGFPFREKEKLSNCLRVLEPIARASTGIRRAGSAALDLAYVAAGRLDGYWESGLNAWDFAAGALLVVEAGGLVSDLEGGTDYLETGGILAANKKIFKALLPMLHPRCTEAHF